MVDELFYAKIREYGTWSLKIEYNQIEEGETMEQVRKVSEALKHNIGSVIKGKEDKIEKIIIALLCEGHILLEDLPGTGKTTIAKALSKSLDCNFKRIQFTPDLLPTDLMGVNFYNQKQGDFIFREGPIFTNILLADEINRATPRTQSSLLECMEETQVSIDGVTYPLEQPFLVIATQNPIETQGTFPLPEAQLDRFFMKLGMGYPEKEDEINILTHQRTQNPLEALERVVTKEELRAAQLAVKEVKVSEPIKEYIVNISRATRRFDKIKIGLSLRGSLAMMKAAQAVAAMAGRDFVIPDDVKYIIYEVAMHRIICKHYNVISNEQTSKAILQEIMEQVVVPKEEV